MAIELSNLTFTNEDDIVPASGVEEIVNTNIANTLAGNDIINSRSEGTSEGLTYSFRNYGTLNTGEGNDILTGTLNDSYGFALSAVAIYNEGAIDTGDGNDIITGIIEEADQPSYAIFNIGGTIDTGDGNDIITGINQQRTGILNWYSNINTGDGDDTITGISNAGNGNGLYNDDGTINTGNGDDIITGTGSNGIYNDGIIKTGKGKDSIIADGGFNGTGSVLLGNGKDYLKGFGSGIFNGGNNQDTLELTSGSYTVGISGTTVNFIKDSTIMNTSEFEILIAGGTTYDFSSLTDGQIILA
jgi:hypothetical protein